ncbi:MAG TPA: hypothetical protein VFG83_11110 [Kofleriaceae bacterium]|nr:hypothetical protein [Kofleriaceae bacterium]
MDLHLLAAQYVVGLLRTEELSSIATDLLVGGVESPSFVLLAGALPSDPVPDLRDLLEAGLNECGIEMPSRVAAARQVTLHLASQVATGRLPPESGAAQMVDLYLEVGDQLPPGEKFAGDALGIARLLALYYDFDDVAPWDPAWKDIEREIIDECRAIAGA